MSSGNKYARRILGIEADAAGNPVFAVVDVYSVLNAFEVFDPAVAHAVKKLLLAGQRGHKDRATDLREARASLDRAIGDAEFGGGPGHG